ncbi:unnamed protein product [Haemonchus placei]|uniref:Uncharacterized protein n=1 Tax=Haemonchus placei TaxID=6290 RepID=A0A3P7XG46_HAEPC|nr:unnamed protein product [Haemonchus placei]
MLCRTEKAVGTGCLESLVIRTFLVDSPFLNSTQLSISAATIE